MICSNLSFDSVGLLVLVAPQPTIVPSFCNLSNRTPWYLYGKQAGATVRFKVAGRCNFTRAMSFFSVTPLYLKLIVGFETFCEC